MKRKNYRKKRTKRSRRTNRRTNRRTKRRTKRQTKRRTNRRTKRSRRTNRRTRRRRRRRRIKRIKGGSIENAGGGLREGLKGARDIGERGLKTAKAVGERGFRTAKAVGERGFEGTTSVGKAFRDRTVKETLMGKLHQRLITFLLRFFKKVLKELNRKIDAKNKEEKARIKGFEKLTFIQLIRDRKKKRKAAANEVVEKLNTELEEIFKELNEDDEGGDEDDSEISKVKDSIKTMQKILIKYLEDLDNIYTAELRLILIEYLEKYNQEKYNQDYHSDSVHKEKEDIFKDFATHLKVIVMSELPHTLVADAKDFWDSMKKKYKEQLPPDITKQIEDAKEFFNDLITGEHPNFVHDALQTLMEDVDQHLTKSDQTDKPQVGVQTEAES